MAECRNSGTISKGISKGITNLSGRRLKQVEAKRIHPDVTLLNINFFLYGSAGEAIGRQW